MTRKFGPYLQGRTVTMTHRGVTKTRADWGTQDAPPTALIARGGEINTYSTEIVSPTKGKAISRTGGGTTLDLKGVIGPETLSAQDENGNPIEITVLEQHARDGWAPADYYMLETDPATGDLIVEPGMISPEIYITASPAAYTEAMIAAEVGGGLTSSSITGAWIKDNNVYGRSQEKAVSEAVAIKWVNAIAIDQKVTVCPVYTFERGYQYSGDYATITRNQGQDPMHPRVFKAWGEGEAPRGMNIGTTKNYMPTNTVCIGVDPNLGSETSNILIADLTLDNFKKGYGFDPGQYSSGWTLYRTFIHNASKSAPSIKNADGTTQWDDSSDRASGIYSPNVKGILFEKCGWFMNGWGANTGTTGGWEDGEGYSYGQNREGNKPQTPSGLSHNVYLDSGNYDVTIRNNVSIKAANSTWQFRMGGWLLNNISIDDGIHGSGGGVNLHHDSNQRGTFTMLYRQVATSSPVHVYNRNRVSTGARGMDYTGNLQSIYDSVIMHAADPDNATEQAAKASTNALQNALADAMKAVRNTNVVAWNWRTNHNVDKLNASLMNTTTIQRFGASKRGQASTIDQFARWLIESVPVKDRFAVVSDAIKYFLTAIQPVMIGHVDDPYRPRDFAVHQVFDAIEGSDGFRWDYPLHWSQMWIPGQNAGDTVDLNGNSVKFLIDTATVAGITFNGGDVTVSSGKLTVGEHTGFARVTAMNCGQYIAPLGAGDYTLRHGGRVVLPEGVVNVSVEASGQSQLLLPRDATLTTLHITGGMGWVGWDQIDGDAELEITDALIFEFTPVLKFGYMENGTRPWDLEIGKFFNGETSGFTGEYDSVRRVGSGGHFVRVRDAVGIPVVGEVAMRGTYLPRMTARSIPIQSIHPAEVGKLERFRSGRMTAANPTGRTAPGVNANALLPAGLEMMMRGAQYAVPGQQYDLGGGAGTGVTYVNSGVTLPTNFSLNAGKLIWTAPN